MPELAPIAGIVIVLYVIVELLKRTVFKNHSNLNAVIPFFCAIVGGVVCVILYYVAPETIGVADPLSAAVAGIASGLVATGANQVYKQATKMVAVGNSIKAEVDTEVAGMTDEQKKEYMKDQINDVLEKVVESIPQENSTEVETNNTEDNSSTEEKKD